jgi:hypothetical protein
MTDDDWNDEIELADPSPLPGDEIDDDDDCLHVAGLGAIPPDALKVLLSVLLPKRKAVEGKLQPRIWKVASVRLAALAHAIDLDGLGSLPITQIAEELGVTRAALSHVSINLRDGLSLPRRGGKSDEARKVYQQRARRVWQRRKSLDDGE